MPVALTFRIFLLLLAGILTLLAIGSPATLFLLGQVALIVTVGLLAFVFPTTVMTMAVVSLTFSPENFQFFDRLNLPMNVGAVHKFIVLIATVPMVLRYGVNLRMNGCTALILSIRSTNAFARS